MTTGGGGGATGGGGGGAADAGDGVWDFANLTLNPAPSNSGNIVGFAETDAGIYALSGSGRLYRSSGGPFTELFAFPSLQPLDFEASASGHFFIVTTVHFLECGTGCDSAANWVDRTISASAEVLDSLCVVDDNHVLAIGNQGGGYDGIAYRWNGTTLASSPTMLGVTDPTDCWKGASGDFFIPADDTVVRYAPGSQAFTLETAGPMPSWRGGGSSPGHEWVTGLGPVIAERGQTSWTTVFTGSAGSLNTVVGISPTLAFAFGGGFNSSGQAGFRFNGTTWSAMTPDLPVMNVAQSSFRASDGTVFVGGNDANQFPVIVRGSRR